MKLFVNVLISIKKHCIFFVESNFDYGLVEKFAVEKFVKCREYVWVTDIVAKSVSYSEFYYFSYKLAQSD